MEKTRVVTLGREFCCGGHEVARLVAEKLKVPYYDKDFVDHAVEMTNLPRQVVEENEEKPKTGFLRGDPYAKGYYMNDPTLSQPVHERIFRAQSEAIRRMAGAGDCVIVGRCADFVLGEVSQVVDVLSVFVCSGIEKRIERCSEIYKLSLADARKLVQNSDRIRSKYYAAHTGRNWGSSDNYDLIIDISRFGIEESAELIVHALELKKR